MISILYIREYLNNYFILLLLLNILLRDKYIILMKYMSEKKFHFKFS